MRAERAQRAVTGVRAAAETGARPPEGWDGALSRFEALLTDIEQRLAAEDWETAAEELARHELDPPEEEPDEAERERARELIEYANDVQRRLSEAMTVTRDELAGLGRRREAAAGYLRNAGDEVPGSI